MDYGVAKSLLPEKSLGSTVRDDIIKKIKTRLNSKAYTNDPSLIKKNRSTLKKIRNTLKKSHKGATQKNLIKKRFNIVNTLLEVFGEPSNVLSDENVQQENISFASSNEGSRIPEAPPNKIATLANLRNNIKAIDYSIEARANNEKRLSEPIVFEQNAAIDKIAQKDVRIKLEQLGFQNTSDTSAPEKVFIKTDSRADGDCLPSSIYRIALEHPEIADTMVSVLELPMEDETSFIQEFRALMARTVLSGVLPSESPGEDIYTRARDYILSGNTSSYNTLKESFTRESRDALEVIEREPENREDFLEAYAAFLGKGGNWMTHNEIVLINQIFGAFNLHVFSFSNNKKIPAHLSEKVNGVYVLYVYNPDQTHYIYFSMKVPESQEQTIVNRFKNYMEKTVRDRLLENIRSERAELGLRKQKMQAQLQSLERTVTPPRRKLPTGKLVGSLTSSPQSTRSFAPPSPLSQQKKKPGVINIVSDSPSGSVSSKSSQQQRYDPLTGQPFVGTKEEWLKRMKEIIKLEELRVMSSLLF